jgi:hypothetical protein
MDPIGALAIVATLGICSLFFLAWLVMYPQEVAQFFREEWRDRR